MEPAPPGPHDAALDLHALGPAAGMRLTDDFGTPVPGAALILAAAGHAQGLDMDGRLGAAAGVLLNVPEAALREVAAWYRELVTPAAGDSAMPVLLCRGVNCSLRGADAFHQTVRRFLREARSPRPVCEVCCLNRCDRGPSVRLGRRTYCGTTNLVDEDEPEWHEWPPFAAPGAGA